MTDGRITLRLAKAVGKEHDELTRDECRLILILLRIEIRNIIAQMLEAMQVKRKLERKSKHLLEQGVSMITVEISKRKADQVQENARLQLAAYGETAMQLLDIWQIKGATLLDLCYLCWHEHRRTLREIEKADPDARFSALMFVFNLDFRNDRVTWLEYETDAPLTHAAVEYMRQVLLTSGHEASDRAIMEVFPDSFERQDGTPT